MGKWGNEEKPITSLFNLENLIKKKICRTDVQLNSEDINNKLCEPKSELLSIGNYR